MKTILNTIKQNICLSMEDRLLIAKYFAISIYLKHFLLIGSFTILYIFMLLFILSSWYSTMFHPSFPLFLISLEHLFIYRLSVIFKILSLSLDLLFLSWFFYKSWKFELSYSCPLLFCITSYFNLVFSINNTFLFILENSLNI